jgi:YfiH family protein
VIEPDWRAPRGVRAFVTTRDFGDVLEADARRRLRGLLPAEPAWLQQVHGKQVIVAGESAKADAVVSRRAGSVCAVMIADCMPVLFADEAGTVVAAAHAGWRGLAAGVLEATMDAMQVPRHKLHAWLGPAIGPQAYEVGDDVRAAFRGYERAFRPTRPAHWLLDLYAVAREKLKDLKSVSGGGFCTYSEPERFYSYRRDGATGRMAAFVWLA